MARTSAESTYLMAKESFVGGLDGRVVEVFKGDLATSDSDVAQRWPDKFTPLPVRFRGKAAPAVEQATAAPGEKRGR